MKDGFIAFTLSALGAWVLSKIANFLVDKGKSLQQSERQLSRYFTIDDALVSRDFPEKIKKYRLTNVELANAKRSAMMLEVLVGRFGMPRILSWGRPPSVGDFYTALRKRGYDPKKNSQHNVFAAVDVRWPSVSADKIWNFIQKRPEILQAIYYKETGKPRFHLSVYEPKRPYIKFLRLIKQ